MFLRSAAKKQANNILDNHEYLSSTVEIELKNQGMPQSILKCLN